MKNLIILILLAFIGTTVSAQSTSPRFGTSAKDDNTGRVLTYSKLSATDAAGADSTVLYTNAYSTVVAIALTDSFTLKSPAVKKCFYSDRMTIIASGASGKKLKFTGTNWVTAGTATLSSGGKAVINFVFDGAKWVEEARVVQ